jgi:Domain of unknown function (DUF1877)
MSIICSVLGISPAQISAVRATPPLASDLARTAEDIQQRAELDQIVQRMSPEQRQKFKRDQAAIDAKPRAREIRTRVAAARARAAALGPVEEAISLEKSWHMLHYLFTGHIGPASAPGDLLLTGEELGEDVGYGPPRLHGPAAARNFSQFLEAQDLTRLQARVDYREMSRLGVYAMPGGQGSEVQFESDLRNEVGWAFPLLRGYVGTISHKGYGLLIWLS